MSKKDLLERVTRAPAEKSRARREDEAAPRPAKSAVTTS